MGRLGRANMGVEELGQGRTWARNVGTGREPCLRGRPESADRAMRAKAPQHVVHSFCGGRMLATDVGGPRRRARVAPPGAGFGRIIRAPMALGCISYAAGWLLITSLRQAIPCSPFCQGPES